MKQLPIGIQSFSEIITKGYLYVDKTQYIADLLRSGKYFFFSRPRRFGKSLLLSTIKEVYEGNKTLFKALWIENQWDWSQVHPIIHIGFSSLNYQARPLGEVLGEELDRIAASYQLQLLQAEVKDKFRELLGKLSASHGQIVILIDEYDKPIIDYLGKDTAQAQSHQQLLKAFYSVIKDADPFIQFLLITGVSKFSKVSIFSELNNLLDISLNKDFVDLLGISEDEIDVYLADYLPSIAVYQEMDLASLRKKIQSWYNGYSWDGKTFIYNPFSLLIFIREQEFRNYWFETGTPSFLLELMKDQKMYRFENLRVNESSFAAYDIKRLRLLPLLFQTGYLTIKEKGTYRYLLDYPNKEVRASMYQYIMGELMYEDPAFTTNTILDLREAFWKNEVEEVIDLIKSIFGRIPYEIFIANQEAYYHSLIYITFQFLGNYAEAEVSTNKGRIDAVVHTPTDIYLLEFKLDESAEAALIQIHERKYYEKYTHLNKQIHLLGIGFSSKEKSIEEWKLEHLTGYGL